MKAMKVLLIILLILQILAGGFVFFAFLPSSIILALVWLAIAILQIVLTVAVIRHCDEIEDIWDEIYRLRGAVRQLQNVVEPPEEVVYPIEAPAETSQNVWECVKCTTVNKTDTTRCSHCGAAYVASVNPTDDPTVKRKMSRWIKEGKTRRGLFDRNTNS
ncbi:MAG: zinc finger Ran-binding domain-containing family 2 protein [Clostridia bacterium]|nr:zinc finger Ran-binding domain-containing family 2 protein [Clostridia bacterium]